MMKKLKTWRQFEKEFKPLASEWNTNYKKDVVIKYNGMKWYINKRMIEAFGDYIDIKENENQNRYRYTYKGYIQGVKRSWFWHELWFESEEFFKEEEFEI